MPELPEIYHLRDQLNQSLTDLSFSKVVILQPKSSNVSEQTFNEQLKNQKIIKVSAKGKWLFIHFENKARIAINLGMGGEISLVSKPLDKKHQCELYLSNGKLLNIRFWWFGYVHLILSGQDHPITDRVGIDYLDERCTLDYFSDYLNDRRGSLKNFLLNQHHISGIGNYYIHDILYLAKCHPKRLIPSLSEKEIKQLYDAIQKELFEAYQSGGSYYEEGLFQQKGTFKADKVAYKDEQICACGHEILKIKTGQTTSYYCPSCQK